MLSIKKVMHQILNKVESKENNFSIKLFIMLVMAMLFVMRAGMVMAINARACVKDGNRLYEEKKYDQALTKYQDALLAEPKNEKIEFNIANSLYMKKKYEDALKAYQKVIGSNDINLEGQTYFNIGNTLYRMGKLPESILAYQQALKLNPNDMDAKYNLEFVRKKLKEQMERQEQNKMSSQNKEHQQKNEGNKQQRQSSQQEKDIETKEKERAEAAKQDEQKELTKEEAERILNALKYDEKDIQKKRKIVPSAEYKVEKDW